MHEFGDLVFPRSRLPGDQHRGIGLRHERNHVEDFLHFRAVADQFGGRKFPGTRRLLLLAR